MTLELINAIGSSIVTPICAFSFLGWLTWLIFKDDDHD